jgi:L-aspartate oxidase
MQTQFLVIGSGIAGLTYALKLAQAYPQKKVIVITKTTADETNTKYAQGGIAGVTNLKTDSYKSHIQDTLVAGDGLCDKNIVEIVVTEGPKRIKELIQWGAQFDKDKKGTYKLGREGGHSKFRILHHKDVTGKEMERALLSAVENHKNIQILKHHFVVDLITEHHLGYLVTKVTDKITCFGAYVLNLKTNKIEKIVAETTMLATGGIGQAYRTTTNPKIATGDGIAMTYRAKGRVENMEFIQFHPTALYEANVSPNFLITEAVRGDGAILRNKNGEAFMPKYHKLKDLAPRDIVARAIDSEMKKHGTEFVFLDCTHMPMDKFKDHFPNIYNKCISIGIDVSKQFIPVAPAAHYSCGGIKTNEWAQSSINNLYAAGECASTGLHGANRLASNSLLEAMVFAHRAYMHIKKIQSSKAKKTNLPQLEKTIPNWNGKGTTQPQELILITQSLKEVQMIMSDYVGIVRNNIRLKRAYDRLELLWQETEQLYEQTTLSPQLLELRNLITIAYLIIKMAIFRKESRGLHYTTDYPQHQTLLQDVVL